MTDESPLRKNPNRRLHINVPEHYRRTQHSHEDFAAWCKQLTESFTKTLEVAVKRVIDQMGLDQARKRLQVIQIKHGGDNDQVIIECRLWLDYAPMANGANTGTLLGMVIAWVNAATNKVENRIDWSPAGAQYATPLARATGNL